ncbi:MAG: AMP-binding protein [Emcibacter sp.]|nr:AMP-binding protein [Emcibacter sp.]
MNSYVGLAQIIERNAQIKATKTAVITEEGQRTWAETRSRIARVAQALSTKGAGKGDKVAILAMNSDIYFECLFSIVWFGGIFVPLNVRWSVAENLYALEDSESRILVFDDYFLDVVGEMREKNPAIWLYVYSGTGKCPTWAVSYSDLLESGEEIPSLAHGGDEAAAIMYTGGTTGQPKGVMLSHLGMFASALALNKAVGFEEDEIYLHAAPMFHGADMGVSLAASLEGCAHTFVPFFDVDTVILQIVKMKVTTTLMVPTMINMLISDPTSETADLSSLQRIVYGGSPITEDVLSRALQLLPHAQFYQAYGQTEMSPLVSILDAKYHVVGGEFLKSSGQAIACVQIGIRRSDGSLADVGEVGEIEVSGPNIMLGYHNKPDETKAALVDGYVRTGDAGYLDANGFLFLADRVKDMIITGGENVFSVEVESVISLIEAVQDVAVIGIPSEKWGEEVHAIIVLHAGQAVMAEDVISFCKEKIAGYKCPKSVTIRKEPLPVSAAGKILKNKLRKDYISS